MTASASRRATTEPIVVRRIFADSHGATYELGGLYGRGRIGVLDEEDQFEGFGEYLRWPLTTYEGEEWRQFTQEEYDALEEHHPAREWGPAGYIHCAGKWRQTTAADLAALGFIP